MNNTPKTQDQIDEIAKSVMKLFSTNQLTPTEMVAICVGVIVAILKLNEHEGNKQKVIDVLMKLAT